MRVVVALGGNLLLPPGSDATVEQQLRVTEALLAHLEPLLEPGAELLFTHGNGPQVGHQLERVERSLGAAYALPLDACVAQTQGELGYLVARALSGALARRGTPRPVAALVTTVEVDPGDPAFAAPTKPVGPVIGAARAEALRGLGAVVRDDAGRGLRRCVPSPEPRRIPEAEVIRRLVEAGVALIAAGGGGVPVIREGGAVRGVEAVVDKDLTAALLADAVEAELLLIVTDVPCAFTGFRSARPVRVGQVTAARARALLAGGHFAPGTMGPKVEACARFVGRPGRRAVICDPPGVLAALRGEAGTVVVPDR